MVMYVNVNTVANERHHAAPPPCDILAFESLIRSPTTADATPTEPSEATRSERFTSLHSFVGFHAFRIDDR